MPSNSLPHRQPDASKHDPRPEYLRALLKQAGLSQRAAARRIGISDRVMRYYLAGESAGYRPAPYPVQFALEALAQQKSQQPPRTRPAACWPARDRFED